MELAGEILSTYPGKRVTLIDANSGVLKGFDTRSCKHCDSWLRARGAELMLGERITSTVDGAITLESGRIVRADVVYRCTGWQPNTALLGSDGTSGAGGTSSSPLAVSLGVRGAVVVNDFLQVSELLPAHSLAPLPR